LVVCDWLTARGHKWVNIGGGENDRKSANLVKSSSFEEKAKLPNLLDKKEFNDRAFYPIGPKLDHNVNQ
jgi:NADPH-dependent 7-cyano-7-deazaguanine reductase QueF-like protein